MAAYSAARGAFNLGLFFPLLTVAVYRLPGGVAAAAGGLQPLLVATLAGLVTRRRPRPADLFVGVVAALGVTMVLVRPGAGFDPIGLAAALAANVSFAAGVVLVEHYPAPSNPLSATGWQMLLGGVLLVPRTAAVEAGGPPLSGRNLADFAYLSLAATALAFVLWTHGVRRRPSAAPSLLGLAAPPRARHSAGSCSASRCPRCSCSVSPSRSAPSPGVPRCGRRRPRARTPEL